MSICADCQYCSASRREPPCSRCTWLGNGPHDMFIPISRPEERDAAEQSAPAEVEIPPLGLRPRYVLLDHRAQEIKEAIERRLTPEYIGKYEIPLEWVREYNQVVRESKEVNKKSRCANASGKE